MEFRTEVIRKFDDIDQRLETMSSALAGFDTRIPALTKSVIRLEERVYDLHDPRDVKIAELDARLRKLEGAA
jgi:hypothetical protein